MIDIDLLDIKQYNNKPSKNIIILIVLVSIIILAIIIAIIVIKKNSKENLGIDKQGEMENNNIDSSDVSNNQDEIKDENIENKGKQVGDGKNKLKHISNINYLPNYTEQAKEKMKNIYHSSEKVVYLTFDDGPSKSVTPLILDLLKQENIKATFFVLGSRAELNPDILKREYEEGHYIANHGYSHIYKDIYNSPQSVLDEYTKTQNVIKNVLQIEYEGHLFRFPGGATGGKYKDIKNEAKILLENNNISYIDWNALSQDSAGAKTKEALVENVKKTVGNKNSVVILMHDAGDKILTYETLPEVISYLREQGYTFKSFYNIMK